MRFWDPEIWASIVQFGIIMTILLVANGLRRKVGILRKSLLPTAVIGGIMILLLKLIPFFNDQINKQFFEMITYHTLGLGFISLALKVRPRSKERKTIIIETGAITVTTYLLQGVIGLVITLLLSLTFMQVLFPASGLLLPLGFGQGPGQALNFGTIYAEMGFAGGADFGLTIAGVGFLTACIVGVVYLNILNKKKLITRAGEGADDAFVSNLEVASPDEIPLTESIDKFTMQVAFVLFTYFLTYLLLRFLTFAVTPLGDFAENTVIPLLWGFNFLFGTIVAVFVGIGIRHLKRLNIMTRQYPNNFMLNRIGGIMFDIMVIASIGAIEMANLKTLFIPLALICAAGAVITFVYLKFVCRKMYPDYEYQAFFSLFGMLTGTASTGMVLLREVDPRFETPAANNLVMQNFPAIVFGFPLLLLITFAPLGMTQLLITLAVLIIMIGLFNLFILRKHIFKKKTVTQE